MNRLNFFIVITSSILSGLVILRQSSGISSDFLKVVAIAAICFLILIGWDTFRFTITRDIHADDVLRKMGRIRCFFVEQYPPIEKHLPWQVHDEPTGLVTHNRSGIRQTAQTILSLLFSLAAIIIASFVTKQLFILISGGIIIFAFVFLSLRFYVNKRYKKARIFAQESIKFPSDSSGK